MSLFHRPRWVAVERTGTVVTERCAVTRVRVADGAPVHAHEVARAGFRAAIVQAWPDLVVSPLYAEALADMAMDAILPELGR